MYGTIFIKRDIRMQVQLNTTTNNYQNPNFNAKFSKSAQAHIDKELLHLENCCHDEMYGKYYIEYKKFAMDIIEGIKTAKDKMCVLIDINDRGDRFECRKYRTAIDMLKENGLYGQTKIVDKHIVNPLVDVLLAIKSTLLGDKYKQEKAEDEKRYNEICKLLRVRPDSDFWMKKWPYSDVRNQEISIKYKPWKLHINEHWKGGKHHLEMTWRKQEY